MPEKHIKIPQSYEKIPPTSEQLILVEKIKSIVSCLLNKDEVIDDSNKDIDFVERWLWRVNVK